ncbi:MAG: YbjN domain-containing protein [Planctomycetia bacterium]|nr:YbjN domain-containing protein [Planctomycetia bacterium]
MSTVSPVVLERCELNRDSVQRVFEAACLQVGLDDHGALIVTDFGLRYVIIPDDDGDDILMFVVFGFSDSSSDDAQISAAAEINATYKMVRAAVHYKHDVVGPHVLVIDYLLCTAGGVTPRTIISAWQRFATIVRSATYEANVRVLLA